MLEPEYGANVVEVLDKIEYDQSRKALWNAICDAIDLVCDQPDSAEARKDGLVLPSSGTRMWMVPIRCNIEDDDWVLVVTRRGLGRYPIHRPSWIPICRLEGNHRKI